MGFLYKRTDDRDDYAEGPAVVAVGRVLAALLGGERNTKPDPANRTEQQCRGHTMASGIRNRSHPSAGPGELRRVLGAGAGHGDADRCPVGGVARAAMHAAATGGACDDLRGRVHPDR